MTKITAALSLFAFPLVSSDMMRGNHGMMGDGDGMMGGGMMGGGMMGGGMMGGGMMGGGHHHHHHGMMDGDMMGGHHGMMNNAEMMEDCPYKVQVGGQEIEDGACVESPPDGVVANLVWNDPESSSVQRLLVWDTEAPCGDDMVYVHFAGDEDGVMKAPMTAGAGADVHTYMAGWFDTLPVPTGTTGCYKMNVETTEDGQMMGCHHTKQWKVARHSTPCPEPLE